MNVCLMGSVSSSRTVADALVAAGVEVSGILGVSPEHAKRVSDYRDMRQVAEAAGIPYLGFRRVKDPEVEAFIHEHPADMLWVIGLSQLVPDKLIALHPAGGVGFHPTLLPEGRGRAPVAWTILRNARAAANLFYLCEEADAGDIIIQREVPVLPDDYAEDLIERTNEVLADCVKEIGPLIKAGTLPRRQQDHTQATRYPKRTPADGVISWAEASEQTYRLIRAAGRPYPGAFTTLGQHKLTIWRAEPIADCQHGDAPGTILDCSERQLLIATADGAIRTMDTEWDVAEPPAITPGMVLGRSA